MSEFSEVSKAELDALIGRVNEAIEQDLSIADMQLLLNALVMLAQLQSRLADNDITRTTASGKGFLPAANRLCLLACAP